MPPRLTDADYQLRWPRSLFVKEATHLLNNRQMQDWDDRCELLLEDAFVGDTRSGPCKDFRNVADARGQVPVGNPNLNDRHRFLQELLRNADHLHEGAQRRRPYWSQRLRGAPPSAVGQTATVRQFVTLIRELDHRGYFEKQFGKHCVDVPVEVDPSVVIEYEIGVPDLWPLRSELLSENLDLFCDVVEVLHDLVARPESRRMHGYGGCGWHHRQFSIETGCMIYRWRVNKLLGRSEMGLRLAEDGEDVGRMVNAPDDARSELIETMTKRDDGRTGDQVRHAIALFRGRGADRQTKRSAVVALAHVLEKRRHPLIKQHLLSKDEGALFQIANQFEVRHQDATQRDDYDEAFLDWMFWWYLATIELTDRIATRSSTSQTDSDP